MIKKEEAVVERKNIREEMGGETSTSHIDA